MASIIERAPYGAAVWWRHFLVWQKTVWSSLTMQMVNPVLYLFAFGFGLGAAIKDMGGLDYLAFVVPGMMAYSMMFTASFEATISAYSRLTLQQTWSAILATPVSLLELLLGEAGWAITKGLFSALGVVVVGYFWGGIDSLLGAIVSLAILILAGFTFAACGFAATAHAKSWEFVSYFMTFWVTPNFVFSGVFFSIDRFPSYVQALSWLLPTTHVISVVRPLTAGQPLDIGMALVHLAFIALLGAVMFIVAYRQLKARMFD
ncbi:MAG: ABC transporter permease [Alphaproteobacteria bacterium]|nr:ABC transporter permease [Alphaproteobacteria bacterium]